MTVDTLDLGDVTLAYELHGSGEPALLLVHGFTGGKLDWVDVVPALQSDRRVVVYDHRGHGESTNTGDQSTYTFDQLLADMERFVDSVIGPQPFHLLGHSMGGIIAMRYVFAHPERVHSLVLMDTGAEIAGRIPSEFTDYMANLGREQGMGAVADVMIKYLAGTNAAGDRLAVLSERLKWKLERMDIEAFVGLARELNTYPSLVPHLPTIACPTTVIVGENDHGLRDAADVLADAIAGAVLAVIPDAAHSPQDENRAAWLDAVHAHLARSATS